MAGQALGATNGLPYPKKWEVSMKNLKGIMFVLFLLVVIFTMTGDAAARDYKVSYTEPTTNSNGSLLTDLAKCTLYYQIPLGNQTKAWDNPATAAIGGGTITDKVTPIAVSVADEDRVDFWMTCTDTAANESVATAKVRLNLPSGPPIGVILK